MSLRRSLFCAAAGSIALTAGNAVAHPVVVDGSPADWFTRAPNASNIGLVARSAAAQGELIWRDALGDTRTDVSAPEVVADIAAFHVTASPQWLSFLIRRMPGVPFVGAPIQVQIAIDTDRVAGSGQEYFAEFADTRVSNTARWERLVETLFGSGNTARVIDSSFNKVADAQAVAGVGGDIEIAVPWSALGLNGPPTTPLRLSVATFRAQNNDISVDVGGPMISNALDVLSNYGDPAASAYPNTWVAIQGQVLDYSVDVWFDTAGEVFAPVTVQRYVSNSSGGGADEWYELKNNTSGSLPLDGFKVGDEETPDGNEGMYAFPPGAALAAGGRYVVARASASYQAFFAKTPDAELPPGTSLAVPDMLPYTAWTNAVAGQVALNNTGDELLVLDPSSTILDIAVFGNGDYLGVQSFTPAPGVDEVLSRTGGDTDDCKVDFSNAGKACVADPQCGGACKQCVANVCGDKPLGASCADANPCDGAETCDGSGVCVAGAVPDCNDGNACTTDSCAPSSGCAHAARPDGASCADGDVCNGFETCAAGVCSPGLAVVCNDGNPCTTDSCDPVNGCAASNSAGGTPCPDGDACNGVELCDGSGVCNSGNPMNCDDQNVCTIDACDASTGCAHSPASSSTPCADGNVCNGIESCDGAGTCAAGTPPDCDDQKLCTIDQCDPSTGCAHVAAVLGTSCSDNDACNGAETCDDVGNCVAGTALSCNDDNECTSDSCDPVAGCKQVALSDGTTCTAGCTGTCLGSVCVCSDAGADAAGGSGGDSGAGGAAGEAGAAGAAGEGGAAGSSAGGSAGTAGTAGASTGGAAGSAGNAGSSTGGAAGAGKGGSAGASAGAGGATSKGGNGGLDAGGDSGDQPTVPDAEDSGGCGCRTANGSGIPNGMWIVSLLAGLMARRKRSRQVTAAFPR